MSPSQERLETRLYRGYWDDGLIDVVSGIGLIAIGVCWAVGQPVFGALVPALLVPLWGPLRKALVEPRAGYVEFVRERQHRNQRGLQASVVVGVVVLVVFLFATFWLRTGDLAPDAARWSAAIPAGLLMIPAAFAGGLLEAPRFYVYALAFLLMGFLTVVFSWDPSVTMIVVGALALLSGTVLMTRFLRASQAWVEGAP